MSKLTALLCAAMLMAPGVAAAQEQRSELLIVGTPHFGNPGLDIANTKVADVTTAERQREIEAIVEKLAAFRPTHIAIEWRSGKQAELDKRYADYRAGRYKLSADERDQIGLRLAARLGLARIDAVDWSESAPGADADYDYIAYADAHGMGARWAALRQQLQAQADAQAKLMTCTPVASWLRRLNTPEARAADQAVYYDIAQLGDANANPGAAWVGSWYARNLRILVNLVGLKPKPGDRVLAIYGAGHGFLLDQQARESGLFTVADTLDFLPKAGASELASCPD